MKKSNILGKILVKGFLVMLSLAYTSSAIAALVDLRGGKSKEASVTITLSKPAYATNGLLTLVVYDADFPDEGELVINGNTAIPLFGEAGVKANDQRSADITIRTPASYWKDGNNTLLFRHTSTQGYIIDDVTVLFEVSSQAGTAAGSFPIDVTGPTPEEASVTVTVNKPANAVNGLLTLASFDADFPDEGELVINGNTAIPLFGEAGVKANDQRSADITIRTPASYWKDGNNTLLFRHTSTQGYVIDDVTVLFEVSTGSGTESSTESSTGSGTESGTDSSTATTALFSVDMTGPTPEEASVTVTVNKPANAVNGLLTLASFDADFPDEGELVINGNTAIPLFGEAGVKANDQRSADITISTPASYWRDGNNTLLFRHTSTQGYMVESGTVWFETGANAGNSGTSGNPPATGSVNLSWVAPVKRTDGSALALSEISGYTVYYGTSKGDYPDSISINNGTTTSVTVTDLPAGTYYLVVTTRDADGRESGYSSMATKQAQ